MLLVEDDVVSSAALATILRRRGLTVHVAPTLAEGLSALASNPSFVILDLMLPDGDGIKLLKHLHTIESPIKVIVTTAVNDGVRIQAVRQLQPVMILQKPIDLDRLIKALEPMN